jgi:hypothetical protein
MQATQACIPRYERTLTGRKFNTLPFTRCALLGLAVLIHRDDDISFFMSCVDIPVGFGSLF